MVFQVMESVHDQLRKHVPVEDLHLNRPTQVFTVARLVPPKP